MDSSACCRAALELRRTISSSFCGYASSDSTNLSASILTSKKAEADLVLHCLTGFDQQALSNSFAKPSYFLELNGVCEQHPDAGLSKREKAVARRSVISGPPLSTTKADPTVTTIFVVNATRNHSASSFIPLILANRNADISSTP